MTESPRINQRLCTTCSRCLCTAFLLHLCFATSLGQLSGIATAPTNSKYFHFISCFVAVLMPNNHIGAASEANQSLSQSTAWQAFGFLWQMQPHASQGFALALLCESIELEHRCPFLMNRSWSMQRYMSKSGSNSPSTNLTSSRIGTLFFLMSGVTRLLRYLHNPVKQVTQKHA